jgi:DNA-binding CsgD family transcriptional regulator
LSSKHLGLTPAELQIAHLIRDGRTTKEMAGLLNVSTRTVESHRQNIRMKLGLHGKKANLRSHLLSI